MGSGIFPTELQASRKLLSVPNLGSVVSERSTEGETF